MEYCCRLYMHGAMGCFQSAFDPPLSKDIFWCHRQHKTQCGSLCKVVCTSGGGGVKIWQKPNLVWRSVSPL